MYLNFIVACASSGNKNDRYAIYDAYIVEQKLVAVNKIRSFQFRDWKSLDNKHLILSSSHKKQYLIILSNYCTDLDFTQTIGLDQTMSYVLDVKFDAIVVDSNPNMPCRIKSIYPINRAQEKEIISLKKGLKGSLKKTDEL